MVVIVLISCPLAWLCVRLLTHSGVALSITDRIVNS
jgi:hypothetical protein